MNIAGINFGQLFKNPAVSDVANSAYSGHWAAHRRITEENWYWYSGDFRNEIVGEFIEGETPSLKYPVGINLVDMVARMKGGMLLGEHQKIVDGPIGIAFKSKKEKTKTTNRPVVVQKDRMEAVEDAWDEINSITPIGPMLIQESIECWLNGISWFQVKKVPNAPPMIVRRNDSSIFPEWNPDNPRDLTRVTLKVNVNKEYAKGELKRVGKDYAEAAFNKYEETWTKEELIVEINGVEIRRERNMLKDRYGNGMIPFVCFPTYNVGNDFYGETIGPSIISTIKELNLRLADAGDAVEYSSHPIKWIRDFRGKVKNLPYGPDAIWDLGRTLGDSKPEAGMIESKSSSQSASEYFVWLLKFLQMTGHFTDVDIGADEGSQRSGATLEVRKAPALNITRAVRVNWTVGIKSLVQMVLLVYAQTFKSINVPTVQEILVQFAPELPRDRADIVNEITSLRSMTPPMMSVQEAVKMRAPENPEEEMDLLEQEAKEMEAKEQEKADKEAANQKDLAQVKVSAREQQQKATAAKKKIA